MLHQKLFTPPPTDEQQKMQQSVMKFMMLFMGVMFHKVAAGLCIYFIASSLWGLAERLLLPKTKLAMAGGGGLGGGLTRTGGLSGGAKTANGSNGHATARRKRKAKKKR
jgi:YidC/Oxa1 family membrane protein insertase